VWAKQSQQAPASRWRKYGHCNCGRSIDAVVTVVLVLAATACRHSLNCCDARLRPLTEVRNDHPGLERSANPSFQWNESRNKVSVDHYPRQPVHRVEVRLRESSSSVAWVTLVLSTAPPGVSDGVVVDSAPWATRQLTWTRNETFELMLANEVALGADETRILAADPRPRFRTATPASSRMEVYEGPQRRVGRILHCASLPMGCEQGFVEAVDSGSASACKAVRVSHSWSETVSNPSTLPAWDVVRYAPKAKPL